MANLIGILMMLFLVWLVYEAWRAPLWRENPDGSYTEIQPAKKFKDLFKRKK